MKLEGTPRLDSREAAQIFEELLRLRPAWTPELTPAEGDPAWALFQVFARYMQFAIDRLNQAPDKSLLAFLDMLGIGLIRPQPARAPAVFAPFPNAVDASIPARTRLAAKVPSRPTPLIFETERASAMAAAKLTDVFTLWPARDQYTDHSTEAAGKRPFVLFQGAKPIPHELYLAHDTIFPFSGKVTIDVEFELPTPGNKPIRTEWQFWNGQVWLPFREFSAADPTASVDGTNGLTRSGIVRLRAECGEVKKTKVNGIEAHWIRGRVSDPLPPDPSRALPLVDRIRVRSVINNTDMSPFPPEAAFADAQKLDVSKSFYPFDQQPKPGSAFYLSAPQAFGKPGAQVTLDADDSETATEQNFKPASTPDLAFEYWNGKSWQAVTGVSGTVQNFITSGSAISFTVPADISKTKVNDQEALWVRMRITIGSFVNVNTVSFTDAGSSASPKPVNTVKIVTVVAPALQNLLLTYRYEAPWTFPEQCLTYSDFEWQVRSRDIRWPGNLFPVFRPVTDTVPALYFGFDRPLPNDSVGLYLDIQESSAEAPALVWEAWDGTKWTEISASDETGGLSRPGLVSFIPPLIPARPEATVSSASGARIVTGGPLEAARFKGGDRIVIRQDKNVELAVVELTDGEAILLNATLATAYTGGAVTLAALPRFGPSRDWIRARLKEDGAPLESTLNAIYLNAAWAVQVETVTGEVLGGGLAVPNQSFFFNKNPVLPGEEIELRELEGERANVEYPILREELLRRGFTDDDIRTLTDPRTGKTTEVWVRWRSRPHFYFSGPEDRHYLVERGRGRLLFGDGRHGKLPPVGPTNIRARQYQAGGGAIGNVPAGAISQIMSGVLAQGVSNPRAGEGGADGETVEAVRKRGPHVLRHRERALSAPDYETLAREASPAVAAVRVLPATSSNGRPAPGWVTIVIVPQSQDAQPQPSFELRRQVHDFLAARAPATLAAERIGVIGPTYLPVGVSAEIVPREAGEAGSVQRSATDAVARFLHPLTGGPDGDGWPFGRGVFLSDVASVLGGISGVDHVEHLELRLDDAPVGDMVPVPPDRMVVAGPIRLEIREN